MQLIKLSFLLLFKDWKDNINHFLVLVFSVMVTFIFNNMVYNPHLFLEMKINKYGIEMPNMAPFSTIVIILFMATLAIYSYMYLLSKKSLELAILKTSGASFKKMTTYLIVQNIFLHLMAFVLGIMISMIITPLINQIIFSYIGVEESLFLFSREALMDCIKINIIIFFITTFFSLGYIHRKEINNLSIIDTQLAKDMRPLRVSMKVYLCFYIIGLVLLLSQEKSTSSTIVFSLVGCWGVSGMTHLGYSSYIKNKFISNNLNDKIKNISNSNLLFVIGQHSLLVIALFFSVTVMLAISLQNIGSPKEFIITFSSFIVSLFLITLSLLLNYISDINRRKEEFVILHQIGYSVRLLKKIADDEISKYYYYVFLLPFIYMIFILIISFSNGTISLLFLLFILFIYLFNLFLVKQITKNKIYKYIDKNIDRKEGIKCSQY